MSSTVAPPADLVRPVVREIESGVAFLTGVECAAADELPVAGPLVRLAPSAGPDGHFYSTALEEHGTDVVPVAFAALARPLVDSALGRAEVVQGWVAADAAVFIQDFGVGVGTVTWRRDAPETAPDVSPEVVAHLSEAAEAILAPLVLEATRATRASFPGEPQEDGVVGLLRSVEDELPEAGKVLWVWGHLRCSLAVPGDHEAAVRLVAEAFCPNDHTVLSHRDHSYAAGVAVCVTCSSEETFADGVALSRVLVRQDAWWTLVWALDRALLSLQTRVHGTMAVGSIRSLVERARQIEQVTARVQLLRSRIDSVLVSAGARELAVWQSLEKAWQLEFRTGVVQRKLVFLQDSYRSVLSETSRRRAEQVSLMVYVFTAVSVIASAVAVVQYAQGTESSGMAYRIAVVAVCVLAAAGAVLSTLRAQRLRWGRGRR